MGIFGAFAAFTSTMVVGGMITGLISLVFGLYCLYVLVVFVRESMEMSTLKAVIAIFLPVIVIFIIGAVASVMVWYWINPLTSGPPSGGSTTTQYNLIVDAVYKNSSRDGCMSVDMKNTGFSTVPSGVGFEIKNMDGTPTGNYVVVRSELSPGESGTFDIVYALFDSSATTSVPIGSYYLRLSSTMGSSVTSSDIYFAC